MYLILFFRRPTAPFAHPRPNTGVTRKNTCVSKQMGTIVESHIISLYGIYQSTGEICLFFLKSPCNSIELFQEVNSWTIKVKIFYRSPFTVVTHKYILTNTQSIRSVIFLQRSHVFHDNSVMEIRKPNISFCKIQNHKHDTDVLFYKVLISV